MNKRIDELIEAGRKFTFDNNNYVHLGVLYTRASEDFQAWVVIVEDFIIRHCGENSAPFRLYQKFDRQFLNGYVREDFDRQHKKIIAALMACKVIAPNEQVGLANNLMQLQNIFEKFHSVAIQLRNRHQNRTTLDVQDEYDVQDLLHSLLKLHFKDIRKEEWTPSYAGGSSRMDFLLKEEKIIVEVKKIRAGLTDRELGKQLIEDKARYQVHPDCKKLICFVYDPEGRIVNPKGIQNDLNEKSDTLHVEIIIKPDH